MCRSNFPYSGSRRVYPSMTEKFPEMLVGAGTVLTTEQVDAAVKAGAFDKIKELTAEARNLVESIRK